jgi:proteic killer suppression protein
VIKSFRHKGLRVLYETGRVTGRWSIKVNGNWRVTFEFREGNAYVVDYEDYH